MPLIFFIVINNAHVLVFLLLFLFFVKVDFDRSMCDTVHMCICVRVSVVFHLVASLLALWQIIRVKRPLPPPCNETSVIKTPQGHQLQLQCFLLWLKLILEKL